MAAVALVACTPTPEPEVESEQFTRIADTPTPSTKAAQEAPTVTQTVTEKAPAQAPAKPAAPQAPAAAPASGQQTDYSTRDRTVAATGHDLYIMEIRSAAHDGFDRVVYEFKGPGLPGFETRWVQTPMQYGTDVPISMGGNAYLRIQINGTTGDRGKSYSLGQSAGYVEDIYHTGASPVFHDKSTEYFIGLDRQRPYTAFLLENPTRLVVDFES